jgi:hypothetical protein
MYIDFERLDKVMAVVDQLPDEAFLFICALCTFGLIVRALRLSSPIVVRTRETGSLRISIPTYARKRYLRLWGERGSIRWSVRSWTHAFADSFVLTSFFLLSCMPVSAFFWIVKPTSLAIGVFATIIVGIVLARYYRTVRVSNCLRRGDYKKALFIAERAWAHGKPGSGKLLAIVLLHSGEIDRAEDVLEDELLSLNATSSPFPTHRAYKTADLLALLARISLRRKKIDRALYLYRSAVGLCPSHPLALTGLAEVYLSTGKSLDRALRMLTAAKTLTSVQLIERLLLPHRRVRVLGALAWANALAGNYTKADSLLLSGLSGSSRIIAAEKALLFSRAAFVRALEQRFLEAGAYLSIASEFDSWGYVGERARLRLARESMVFPLR